MNIESMNQEFATWRQTIINSTVNAGNTLWSTYFAQTTIQKLLHLHKQLLLIPECKFQQSCLQILELELQSRLLQVQHILRIGINT